VSGGAESSFWDYQNHEIGTVSISLSLSRCVHAQVNRGERRVRVRVRARARLVYVHACKRACTCIRTYNHT
jgi:hypothetical protein